MIAAPASPSKTPLKEIHLKVDLKRRTPNTKVNKGVRELRIPAKELDISVWAVANKKAGSPLPLSATITI
jgi:hypothetical protein